jgi:hypothetical protein
MQKKKKVQNVDFSMETTKSIVNIQVKGIDNLELELITLKIEN